MDHDVGRSSQLSKHGCGKSADGVLALILQSEKHHQDLTACANLQRRRDSFLHQEIWVSTRRKAEELLSQAGTFRLLCIAQKSPWGSYFRIDCTLPLRQAYGMPNGQKLHDGQQRQVEFLQKKETRSCTKYCFIEIAIPGKTVQNR